jgi:hypothetical protein
VEEPAVRGALFRRYLSAIDPGTEVPPTDLLPRLAGGSNRAQPYLYSDAQIGALLAAARSIRFPLTAATCETLIGLLAVPGAVPGWVHAQQAPAMHFESNRARVLVHACPPNWALFRRRTRAAAFEAACNRQGIIQSMARVGSALDNAVAEAFNSTIKVEYSTGAGSPPVSRPAPASRTTRSRRRRPT